jgi:sacsin
MVEGHLYCGLPLPVVSGLPVQINGCFDLDSSRTGLTSDDTFLGTAKVRVEWNRLLLNYAVASAYTDALRSIPREIAENDPSAFYNLWPNIGGASSPIVRDAALEIHRALAAVPLFRCMTNNGVAWRTLQEIRLIPAHAEPDLMEPLVADGLILANPALPSSLVSDVSAAGIEVPLVTPELLRTRWLRSERTDCSIGDAPFPALRRCEWLETVTRFLISDSIVQLTGLPLALLANGKLATFGFTTLFVGTDVQREIFRTRPHWFIDPNYLAATGLRPQSAAKVIELSPEAVMLNLHSVLPKIEVGGRREWSPAGEDIPETKWLKLLLDYLADNAAAVSVSDLEKFPLIPDQHGRLHSPHCIPTPLLRSKAPEGLISALEALGTPLVSGPDELIHVVERFARAFGEELVWDADGPDLIDSLKAYEGEWIASPARNDPSVVGPILDCLAQPRCLDRIDGRWFESLKSLPLIPTGDGIVVSASEPNLFIPSGEQPPNSTGEIKLVRTGPRGRWRPLLEKLGIPTLDLPALIQRVLIPSYGTQAPGDQLEILRYVRDHFSRALAQEAASGGPRP